MTFYFPKRIVVHILCLLCIVFGAITLSMAETEQETHAEVQEVPDLIVDSLVAGETVLEPGAIFRLDANIRNQGTAASDTAELHFYQSSDPHITLSDTKLRTSPLKPIAVDGTRSRWARLSAPTMPGVYYYGVCIDGVENEANTANNCSVPLRVTVVSMPTPSIPGPKIEGPWVWMILPTPTPGGAAQAASGIDFLADASESVTSEIAVAMHGAVVGDAVGSQQWTRAMLAPVGTDNINDMAVAAGLGTGDINDHVAYGCVLLDAPSQQQTTLYVGSDDAVKVWLNGVLVLDHPIDRGSIGYDEAVAVTLQHGTNILVVAVYEYGGHWAGFFGFEHQAEYTVLPPLEPVMPTVDDTGTGDAQAPDMSTVLDVSDVPDLIVDSLLVGETTLAAGATFRLDAIIRNQGGVASDTAELHFYRSSDETLTLMDTKLRTSDLGAVAPAATRKRWARLTAPTTPGVYYYGVCIDAVENEGNTANNCSTPLKITVVAATVETTDTDVPVADDVSADVETADVSPTVDFLDAVLAGKVREALNLPAGTDILKTQLVTLTELEASVYPETPSEQIDPVTNLTGLEYATQLTTLSLVNHNVTDLTPLAGLTMLEVLDLLGRPLDDLSPLKGLTNLRQLFFAGTQENDSNVAALAGLTHLEALNIYEINLRGTDLTWLTGLQNLEVLGIDSSDLQDLTPLATALAGLQNLKGLTLNHNSEIRDVTPLSALTGLEALLIIDTPATQTSINALQAALPSLVIQTEWPWDDVPVAPSQPTPVLPDATALLSNYPNPFNPETWIPYTLATPAEVSVAIYDVRGVLVRQLSLGHQTPGFYQSRARAAYWDGRNQIGEKVASGLYFYVFTAADFSATRKMLIRK